MASAFSDYLPHFAAFGARDRTDRVEPEPRGGNLLAEAEARGRREGEAAAGLKFEVARAEGEADFEFRLAEKQEHWKQETAEVLASKLVEGLAAIESALADKVAHVLRAFVQAAVGARAVAELAQTVTVLLSNTNAVRIKVSGPEPLLNLLRAPLSNYPVDYSENASSDLSVTIDETIIETKIANWVKCLDV